MLEKESVNALEPPRDDPLPCMIWCPFCLDEVKECLMRECHIGLTLFLTDMLINSSNRHLSRGNLIKFLQKYANFGQIIYERTRSDEAPEIRCIWLTMFQLISHGINFIDPDDENPRSECSLMLQDSEVCTNFVKLSFLDKFCFIQVQLLHSIIL